MTASEMPQTDNSIILFDGVCNLCNHTVRFVYQRDPQHHFRFAPLQSATGQALLKQYGIAENLDSVILIQAGNAYQKSDAALRIAQKLNKAWPLMGAFRLVPRIIRNAVYDTIGKHRYQWFGKTESCPIPPKGLNQYFLDH